MVRGVNWTGTAHIGNAAAGADRGGKFAIHVVAASHETGKRFKAYLKNAHTTDSPRLLTKGGRRPLLNEPSSML